MATDAPLVVANVLVSDAAGRVLILRRSHTHPRLPLMWDLPGGIVEPGEDPLEAAKREAFEETGLRLQDLVKFGERTNQKGVRFVLYVAEVEDAHIRLSYEHDRYKWIEYSEIAALELPDRLREVLKKLMTPKGAPKGLNDEANDRAGYEREQ